MIPPLIAYNFSNSESDDLIQRFLDSRIDLETIEVQVLPGFSGEIPEKHCMSLIFVPDTGFDNSQSKLVSKIVDKFIDTIFVIIVTDSLLEVSVRQGHGLKSLCESIKEQYDVQPVCIPKSENMEFDSKPVQPFKRLLVQRARIAENIALLNERKSLSIKVTNRLLNSTTQRLQNFDAVRDMCDRLKALQDSLELLNKLKRLYQDTEANISELNNNWRPMSTKLRDASVQIITKQRSSTYYSYFMSLPVISKMEKLSSYLQQNWITPPKKYQLWLKETLSFISQPKLLMPVVGLFSSGKTTFLNSLLNSTPEKNECLHTDITHNTAMLLCLKGTEHSEPESVNFTWKTLVDIPILQKYYSGENPKRSPITGTIADVEYIGPFAIVNIVNIASCEEYIIVLRDRIKSYIKPGYRINKGDQITKDDSARSESFDDSFYAEVYPYALKCSLKFVKEAIFKKVKLSAEYINRGKKQSNDIIYSIKSITKQKKQIEFLENLLLKINNPQGRGSKLLKPTLADNLVKVILEAELNLARSQELLKSSILLDSEQGWDEFQGKETESGYKQGFAESDHVAWLLEKAEMKVNNSLFKLVELVDTPGINSISQHHDRITFDYIHRGKAFIIFVALRSQDKSQDLALFETITRVIVSFKEQKVDKLEWGERTFIVFNWFHKSGIPEAKDTVVVKRIETLRTILSTMYPYSPPKLYLIDASQSKYYDNRTLLDYPSILQLIEDLPKMVSKHFLNSELRRSLKSLIELHGRSFKSIDEEIQRLKAENNDEYIKKLQSDISSMEKVHKDLNKQIQMVFDELELADTVYPAKFLSKEEFEDKKDYYKSNMQEFNTKRNEIYSTVSGHIYLIKKRYNQYTTFSFARYKESNILNDIPTFLPNDFSAAIDQIVEDWPSWIDRTVKRVIGKWGPWLKSINKDLQLKYYSEQMINTIRKNCNNLSNQIRGWVDNEFERLKKYLESELSNVTASRNKRNEIINCLMDEINELDCFEQNYNSTISIFQQVINDAQEEE